MSKKYFLYIAILQIVSTTIVYGQISINTFLSKSNYSNEVLVNLTQNQSFEKFKNFTDIKGLNLFDSKSSTWKWDTILTYDTSGSFLQRQTQIFDVNGNVIELLKENWQNNNWVNYLRDIYTYDSSGRILSDTLEACENNAWVVAFRNTYLYDINGNNVMISSEQWQDSIWANYFKYTCTYDTNGNRITFLSEEWQYDWQKELL